VTSSKRFVSEPLVPSVAGAAVGGEPQLPPAFTWRDETLHVKRLIATGRSTKEDRGDVYLKRHWFEFEADDGRIATVYFDRSAKPGRPRWWLYSLTSIPER
jgi:hypothetical protein